MEGKNVLYVYYKQEEQRNKDLDLFLRTGVICVKDIYCTRKMQMHKHKITFPGYTYKCTTQKKFKLCFNILVWTSDNSPCFSSQTALCVCSYKSLDMDLYRYIFKHYIYKDHHEKLFNFCHSETLKRSTTQHAFLITSTIQYRISLIFFPLRLHISTST